MNSQLLAPRNRPILRQLLSRFHPSAAEAAQDVCRAAREMLGVEFVYASRIEGQDFVITAVDGPDLGIRAGARMPFEDTFCARALQGEGPRIASDMSVGPYADIPGRALLGLTSFLMSPTKSVDGDVTGTLCVLDRRSLDFGDDELALLDLLSSFLAREIELERGRVREARRAAALEDSRARYHSLVDDMGDIVIEVDVLGHITYLNPAWTELTGRPVAEMMGQRMLAHIHPDDQHRTSELFAATVSERRDSAREEDTPEIRLLAADGAVRWLSVRGRSLVDADGVLRGYRGLMHNVTDRVEAAQRVQVALAEAESARDDAQRASSAKSEFLSRMSHELRTPLNAILGFGQLLELSELPGEDGENVEQILKAGHHLLDLINEVLDIVRIESGRLSLSLEPVEVGPVVGDCLQLVRTAAADRRISLRTARSVPGACVVADRQRLKQVLVNLLSNAVKYNRDGGEVAIGWGPAPDTDDAGAGTVVVGARAGASTEPGTWVRLSVRDTGRGIPADRLADAFVPFERLGADATGVEGTGVGLSVTRTLVEALGGRLGVTSELGQGTTFWVDLPAVAACPPPEPAESDDGFAGTVLYVEDNPSNVTLVRRVLARRPHVRLVVVDDGAEGLEVARRLCPDLLLLDLHLPGMHGSGVLAAVRSSTDERLREVPVVILTADLTDGNERRMLDAGATRFLPKPIDVHQLLAVVDEHVIDERAAVTR